MSDKLQKKIPDSLKENTQYALAFGVIATMLLAVGFPMFVIFFFGIFAYFLWKTFSQPSASGAREIFEFYFSANELLRDDERRWFGFEVQEVIARGERILQFMNGAPPLVYFTLGALYNKIGDHKSAVNHLSYVIENENSDELTYIYPSPDLRNYAKILRKLEREPAEAPQTSAAIRALERARRNRAKTILENSRAELKELNRKKREAALEQKKNHKAELVEARNTEDFATQANADKTSADNFGQKDRPLFETARFEREEKEKNPKRRSGKKESDNENPFSNHKPITEVLHDIYDSRQP